MVCCFYVTGQEIDFRDKEIVDRIPYATALNNLRKQSYQTMDRKSWDECAVCIKKFGNQDFVAEINC